MLFNRLVIASGLTGIVIGVCPQDVLNQAIADDLFQYVMQNCVDSSGASMTSGDLLAGSQCLTSFIAGQTTNAIPSTGPCRSAFQDFVSALARSGTIGTADECKYNESKKKVDVNYACFLDMQQAFENFQSATDFSIVGKQCDGFVVRQSTIAERYESVVVEAFSSFNPTYNIFPNDKNGLCYGCYAMFGDNVNEEYSSGGSPSDAQTACIADPNSDVCVGSTVVVQAKAQFRECSGYEIGFIGPVCTDEQVDDIQTLIPSPFFTLTHCAYNDEIFCKTVEAYFVKIEEKSDNSCVFCYREYMSKVSAVANDLSNGSVDDCTGVEGVWSDACAAAQAQALFDFKVCAGMDLDIEKPHVIIPIVTTLMPQEGVDSSTTTTRVPVSTTTTKGVSSRMMAVGMMSLVIIFVGAF